MSNVKSECQMLKANGKCWILNVGNKWWNFENHCWKLKIEGSIILNVENEWWVEIWMLNEWWILKTIVENWKSNVENLFKNGQNGCWKIKIEC